MAAHPPAVNAMVPVEVNRNEAACAPERYGIPPHIHVCVTGAGTVILDVRRDKYLGLGREETELLAGVVPGWPIPLWRRSECRDEDEALRAASAQCESLVAGGVLERIPEGQKARAVAALGDMRGEWISIGDEIEVCGQVTVRHIVNFIEAFCWARCSLAWRRFSKLVEEVRASKARAVRERAECDLGEVAALVDVFRRLRPYVFAAEGRCLLHALTLTRFLGNYQVHPEWVIGVTTQPWGAHSWVQWGSYLLDSNPEKVCGYTPIMIV